MFRFLGWTTAILLALVLAIAAAMWVSPWPGVLLLRFVFDRGAAAAQDRIAALVPDDVMSRLGVLPEGFPPDMAFDIHRPAGSETAALPVIVWVHGGGFVSGRPGDVANYARMLASKGLVVVSAGYTLAPEARFPTPVEQVNVLLGHLSANAGTYAIDPARILLAGDSAGAQIAAQVALVTTSPGAAADLGLMPALAPDGIAGVILFCGPYDLAAVRGGGLGGWFINTTARAYSGTRDWREDTSFARFSVASRVTGDFPPAFISAGNADPLGPHSVILADALTAAGAEVETLFFPEGHVPPLGHEYQFDLTGEEGQRAFDAAVAFAKRVLAAR